VHAFVLIRTVICGPNIIWSNNITVDKNRTVKFELTFRKLFQIMFLQYMYEGKSGYATVIRLLKTLLLLLLLLLFLLLLLLSRR
jgi:hypothetical protein